MRGLSFFIDGISKGSLSSILTYMMPYSLIVGENVSDIATRARRAT